MIEDYMIEEGGVRFEVSSGHWPQQDYILQGPWPDGI